MLKKKILWLFIIWLGFINTLVSADNLWSEFGDRYCIGSSTFWQWCNFYLQLIDSVPITQMDWYSNSVDWNLNFNSSYNNSNWNFNFFVQTNAYASPVYNMAIFWYDTKLYFLNGYWNYYWTYVPWASDYAWQWFYSDYCYTSLTWFMDCVWDWHNRHDIDSFYSSFNPNSIVWIYAWWRWEYAHWSYWGFFCAKDNLDKFYCFLSTTGSLEFNTSQNTLSYEDVLNISWIENSPLWWWTWWTEETTWWGTLYCPPIKFEIDMYGYKYNTWLCYSNTEEITWWQVTTVTPISIFDAFPTYQNYVQAYNLIQQNCHTDTVNTVEQCQTALQTIWKKPSEILLKLINSNLPQWTSLAKVYQYCHLQLDYTEEEKRNTSTCELKEDWTFYATWITQNNSSNPNTLEWLTEALQESDQTIVIPEDWTIFDDMIPDWIISRKDAILNIDLRKTRTSLTIKIMWLFKTRPIVEWMLPPIITSFLLLIVLFKIFKK